MAVPLDCAIRGLEGCVAEIPRPAVETYGVHMILRKYDNFEEMIPDKKLHGIALTD